MEPLLNSFRKFARTEIGNNIYWEVEIDFISSYDTDKRE